MQRGLEWDAAEVLTFKGADELAAVCVTEWEISQLGPAGVTGRFAWTGFGSNSKSSNQKIPALFCLAKKWVLIMILLLDQRCHLFKRKLEGGHLASAKFCHTPWATDPLHGPHQIGDTKTN